MHNTNSNHISMLILLNLNEKDIPYIPSFYHLSQIMKKILNVTHLNTPCGTKKKQAALT